NRGCLRLWAAAGAVTLPAFRERMEALAADPGSVAGLWAQRRQMTDSNSGMQSYVLLKDGRQLRWLTTRLCDAEGTFQGELHVFEAPPATHPQPAAPAAPDDLFRLTFEKAAVGMTLISSDFRFLRANPSFCKMLGYEERELLERRVVDVAHPAEPADSDEWVPGLAEGHETFRLERRLIHRNGATVWVDASVSVVRDAEGRPVYFIALAEDITERKHEEEQQERRTQELELLATTDALTGLYNHRFMVEFLNHRLSEAHRTGQPVSVLMLDLDRLRDLNQQYGHDAGNRVIRGVADAMRHALREHDVACRYGGDEFVIILAGAPLPAALAAAERVRRRMEQIRPVAGLAEPITGSIGVATYPIHASTAASLLKAADVALYQAKNSGKNRICGYDPSPAASEPDHLAKLRAGLQGASPEAVNTLVTAIDLRDRYTGAHGQRVGRLAVELAVRLGCSEAETEVLRLGAPLLDVGKIGLPDYLLTKPGRFTAPEWVLMRQHPVWGEELVRSTALPPEILELVRWHHERLDGSGYPDALVGDQIPPLVRIVAVADVASALREDRPHRRAWSQERVLEHLRRTTRAKLDGRVVQAYCDLYRGE
ncbi:MAG TPA: diguanylate cyclase, partial [Armatimonadota bacterium]|nr:diguanylate cyclase [Armatimonadota bacterium]